jgi:hypothetical protein
MTQITDLPDYSNPEAADLMMTQVAKGISAKATELGVWEKAGYKKSTGLGTPQITQVIQPYTWTKVEFPPANVNAGGYTWDPARSLWKAPLEGGFWHTIFAVSWPSVDINGDPLLIHRRKTDEFAESTGLLSAIAAGEAEVIWIPDAHRTESGVLSYQTTQSYMQPGQDPVDQNWDGVRVWHNNPVAQEIAGFTGISPLHDNRRSGNFA